MQDNLLLVGIVILKNIIIIFKHHLVYNGERSRAVDSIIPGPGTTLYRDTCRHGLVVGGAVTSRAGAGVAAAQTDN